MEATLEEASKKRGATTMATMIRARAKELTVEAKGSLAKTVITMIIRDGTVAIKRPTIMGSTMMTSPIMVEIPSKVMEEVVGIKRRMAKHLENIEYTRCFEGDFFGYIIQRIEIITI